MACKDAVKPFVHEPACGHVYWCFTQLKVSVMIREEVYFWQIQWAGRWMTTFTRFTEEAIRKEHPEAIRIDGSGEIRMKPESPTERSAALSHNRRPAAVVGFNF